MQPNQECRVCLGTSAHIPIFGDEKDPDISVEITIFGSIQLKKDDDLPKFICKECSILLQSAISFRKSARRTDALLKCRKKEELSVQHHESNPVKIEFVCTDDIRNKISDGTDTDPYPFYVNVERIEVNKIDIKMEGKHDSLISDDDDKSHNINDTAEIMPIDTEIKVEEYNCLICNLAFTASEEYKKHRKKLHTKTKYINCKPKQVENEVENKVKLDLKCGTCNQMFSKKNFAQHLLKVHKIYSTKPKNCPICNLMIQPDYFGCHLRIVHGDEKNPNISVKKGQKCDVCNKFFTQVQYSKHMLRAHGVCATKTKQCPICKKIFRPDYLGRHLRTVHGDKPKHTTKIKDQKCDLCNKFFTTNHYPRHLQEAHQIKPNIPTKTSECPICKKMFRPDYLGRHTRTVHSEKQNPKVKVECPICKKLFAQQYYHTHIKRHDEGLKTNYICDQCGKEFIFQSAFINHKSIHNNELPFKCDHCPYRGRSKHLLRIHTRTHTGDYPYKCTHCDVRCITKSNLNRHMQRHREPIDFVCDTCNRGFFNKLELQRHIKVIHLGIKSHTCSLCGAAFGYKHGLLKHLRKVHKRIRGVGKNATYLKLQNETLLQENYVPLCSNVP